MGIPKLYPFRKLKKLLSEYNISWDKTKGKGSHGSFVGPNKQGEIHSFVIPRSQHPEVKKHFIKEVCRRFDIDENELFRD